MAHRYSWVVWRLVKDIILITINAKWIHPSLALRLLKANLGSLEDSCEIIEFALRQPLSEKTKSILAGCPKILGISVSIWNHLATIELLEELNKVWSTNKTKHRPIVVLGGPEVSYLPEDANIFRFADYVIRQEGEIAFKKLCETIILSPQKNVEFKQEVQYTPKFISGGTVNLNQIKSAYNLYTKEDVEKKLIYVEASRGCLFNCEFCLSAVNTNNTEQNDAGKIREFPLEEFFKQMDDLVKRGVKTFKFLDRTFNSNIKRAIQISEYFLDKIEQQIKTEENIPLVVHFEMVSLLFPQELNETLARFPPGTLRLEIGIQTLNPEVAARINVPSNPQKELETLQSLRKTTNAIIHADLIAGLPGEDLESFGKGFDNLWLALSKDNDSKNRNVEIQLGILKLLPGTPICRFKDQFKMRYNHLPPYEIEETSAIPENDLKRIKNFARFWEMIVNRGLVSIPKEKPVFKEFMSLSDNLVGYFGRNWGIDKAELLKKLQGSPVFM
jgi:radical SAM superfamily enzyme YgiQ (UPF0313 family)